MGRRLKLVLIIFLTFYLLIIYRLFSIQIASSDILQGLAEGQRLSKVKIKSGRGKIYASDGSPLVLNQTSFGIYLEPQKISNRKKTFSTLAKELGIKESTIASKLNNSSPIWVSIAHRVNEENVEKLKDYKLEGVNYIEEPKRYYPEASMAAHILGFVGKDSAGEDKGYFGIEGYYDEQLRGRDGYLNQEEDAYGNLILLGKRAQVDPEDGRDLTLYLDKAVQFIVEKKLEKAIEKYKAEGGSVIVVDPYTGGILASASRPSYDPAKYYEYPSEIYKNPVVSDSYEPGSTFKVLIMAATLNENKVKTDTKFNEAGPVEIGGYKIRTWNNKYHGEIKLSQILEYSSNVGMVFVSKKLGRNNLLKYLSKLGIGKKIGVDLQEEAVVEIRPRNKWYDIDFATASFGQGIAVTPIQMIRAVSAIANGGKLMKPYAVKVIHLKDGKDIYTTPEVDKQVFRPEVARLVKEMMVNAVENGETRLLKPSNYRIAGKTGTAQIPIAGHYEKEKTIASFVGFAPVDVPKFVMLITIDRPTTSPWGSETAAPLFFDIAKELFVYYGISETE